MLCEATSCDLIFADSFCALVVCKKCRAGWAGACKWIKPVDMQSRQRYVSGVSSSTWHTFIHVYVSFSSLFLQSIIRDVK